MSFTPNIPASGQKLGNSRLQVLNNFGNYNTVMSVNHVAPNAIDQGKHKFMQMPVQASAPSSASGEGVMYTKTAGSQSIPFYKKDNLALVYPLLPIRAMVRFTIAAANGADPIVGTALNVSSVVKLSNTYTITFDPLAPLPDANYLILFSQSLSTFSVSIDTASLTTVDFDLTITGATAAGQQIHLIVLHYVT